VCRKFNIFLTDFAEGISIRRNLKLYPNKRKATLALFHSRFDLISILQSHSMHLPCRRYSLSSCHQCCCTTTVSPHRKYRSNFHSNLEVRFFSTLFFRILLCIVTFIVEVLAWGKPWCNAWSYLLTRFKNLWAWESNF